MMKKNINIIKGAILPLFLVFTAILLIPKLLGFKIGQMFDNLNPFANKTKNLGTAVNTSNKVAKGLTEQAYINNASEWFKENTYGFHVFHSKEQVKKVYDKFMGFSSDEIEAISIVFGTISRSSGGWAVKDWFGKFNFAQQMQDYFEKYPIYLNSVNSRLREANLI